MVTFRVFENGDGMVSMYFSVTDKRQVFNPYLHMFVRPPQLFKNQHASGSATLKRIIYQTTVNGVSFAANPMRNEFNTYLEERSAVRAFTLLKRCLEQQKKQQSA
jgi:hypothetical protein